MVKKLLKTVTFLNTVHFLRNKRLDCREVQTSAWSDNHGIKSKRTNQQVCQDSLPKM